MIAGEQLLGSILFEIWLTLNICSACVRNATEDWWKIIWIQFLLQKCIVVPDSLFTIVFFCCWAYLKTDDITLIRNVSCAPLNINDYSWWVWDSRPNTVSSAELLQLTCWWLFFDTDVWHISIKIIMKEENGDKIYHRKTTNGEQKIWRYLYVRYKRLCGYKNFPHDLCASLVCLKLHF